MNPQFWEEFRSFLLALILMTGLVMLFVIEKPTKEKPPCVENQELTEDCTNKKTEANPAS